VRYTVERPTCSNSASSVPVCPPSLYSCTRCFCSAAQSLGCLPRSRPFALAIFMPSLVRSRERSTSNSAIIANALNNSFPTGSVGSCTEPPILSFTSLRVSSSAMSPASRTDRASRSSFVTTSVDPSWHAAIAPRNPGRLRSVPVNP